MATKTLNTRIQNKYDSESNWNDNPSFVPLEGEMIIYAADANNSAPRVKFGDGETAIEDLHFAAGSPIKSKLIEITDRPLAPPLTYNGKTQEPTWVDYDSSKMYISGVTRATNAGQYTAKFTPLTGYCWSDGSTESKPSRWNIQKATGSLVLSETSVGLPISTASKTVTIVTDSDGTITATCDEVFVTVEVFGKSVILRKTGQSSYGTATVTVNLAEGTNYTAASATISVTLDNTLEVMSWADIRSISASGQAANYFAVGDTKTITLNGQIGTEGYGLTLNNKSYKVFILGIDHNSSREGTGIHFGGFRDPIVATCLCDDTYESESASENSSVYCFNMNPSKSNSGGWNSCRMRYNILGSTDASGSNASLNTATNPVPNTLMAALPANLRAVMQPMTKYTDNTGGGTDDSSSVTATIDFLPLLAEFEVFGFPTDANVSEQNYQAQYAYFANGNSKIFFNRQTDNAAKWRLRSPYHGSTFSFGLVTENGNANSYWANVSYGIVPVFKV